MTKEEILKVIGQLQYEISLLGHSEEDLTGVTIRTDELKELVKKITIPVVGCSCADKEKQAYEKGWEDGAKVGADDVSSRM